MPNDNFRSPILKMDRQCNDQKEEQQYKMGYDGNVLRSAFIRKYEIADSQQKIIISMTTYDKIA